MTVRIILKKSSKLPTESEGMTSYETVEIESPALEELLTKGGCNEDCHLYYNVVGAEIVD